MSNLERELKVISKDGINVDVRFEDMCPECGGSSSNDYDERSMMIEYILNDKHRGYVEDGKFILMVKCNECLMREFDLV